MKNTPEIIITHQDGNWTYGHIGGYDFEVKHWPEPSIFGIESGEDAQPGRISKLWITRSRTYGLVAAYDQGWDRLPRSDIEIQITQAIIDRFN